MVDVLAVRDAGPLFGVLSPHQDADECVCVVVGRCEGAFWVLSGGGRCEELQVLVLVYGFGDGDESPDDSSWINDRDFMCLGSWVVAGDEDPATWRGCAGFGDLVDGGS